MELEKQVISLPLAKRLKELGVNRRSLHCWLRRWHDKPYVLDGGPVFETADPEPYFAAFTVAELGEMLRPVGLNLILADNGTLALSMTKHIGRFIDATVTTNTEADARAKMLILLIEKGLVKP